MRGEDSVSIQAVNACYETPPRARGRHPIRVFKHAFFRNTPACAGKTVLRLLLMKPTRKHPRVRGEDIHRVVCYFSYGETPPRARGRRVAPCAIPELIGNTPACAGKTSGSGRTSGSGQKHPRVRGEDIIVTGWPFTSSETPPRARGRRYCLRISFVAMRNTPACAGKTLSNRTRQEILKKHPRVRGEDNIKYDPVRKVGETPPRARGRLARLPIP